MDKIALLIFCINIICAYGELNITELRGPESVEYGKVDDVVLDCDFEAVNERDLEIKWYYNGDREIIYQWVPDSKKSGFAMGPLKDHIDASYTATNDSDTMYRALRILNVTTDLSGNYTCKVSSFKNEVYKTKQLIVYIPSETGLEIEVENETVTCTINGVYPKPEINLYIGSSNSTEDEEEILIGAKYEEDENGLYNVSKVYSFSNRTDLSRNIEFICKIRIPDTDYFLEESIPYDNVEVNVYDEEDYIRELYDNSSSEEYPIVKEENSAMVYFPGVSLTGLILVLLIISK